MQKKRQPIYGILNMFMKCYHKGAVMTSLAIKSFVIAGKKELDVAFEKGVYSKSSGYSCCSQFSW